MSIQRLSNSGQSGYRYKSLIAGITPVASVPTIGAATAVTYSTASVAFTAPGAYAATTYTATSSPGGLTGTSASSPITVSGLSDNTAYTFTVTATNASGTSSPSAASSSITTPSAFTPESGYDSLATVTLSGSSSSISFAGIPSGYKHLQLRMHTRASQAGTGSEWILAQFNSDATAGNYSFHYLGADGGGTVVSGNSTVPTGARVALQWSTSNPSSVFHSSVVDILDYNNTNKTKTIRSLSGSNTNTGTYSELYQLSNNWHSTSAITSVTLASNWTFGTYSSFALYGVK